MKQGKNVSFTWIENLFYEFFCKKLTIREVPLEKYSYSIGNVRKKNKNELDN